MSKFTAPLYLVYDGDCLFCIRSLSFFIWLDIFKKLELVNFRLPGVIEKRFPQIPRSDLDNAMYAVDADGRTYRGFFAFRRMIWSSPFTLFLVPLFYFPGAAWLGQKVYSRVAANRRWMGCASDTCEIKPKGK